MNRLIVFVVQLGVLCFLAASTPAQSPRRHTDSTTSSTKGDVLDGIKYFIRIVPVDTAHQEKMPMYRPPQKDGSTDEFVAVNREPVILKRVEPEYPEEAKRLGIEGTVWLNCRVGANGKVKATRVLRADAKVLVEPAIRAGRQWEFAPAQLRGKPVAVWATIPFRFKLEK